jgi:hypothetical protein
MSPGEPHSEENFFEDLDDEELVALREQCWVELARRAHIRSHGEEEAA